MPALTPEKKAIIEEVRAAHKAFNAVVLKASEAGLRVHLFVAGRRDAECGAIWANIAGREMKHEGWRRRKAGVR